MKHSKKAISLLVVLTVLISCIAISVQQIFAAGKSPYESVAFTSHDDWTQGEDQDIEGIKDEAENVGGTSPDNWLAYQGYDFGTAGAVKFTVTYSSRAERCVEDGKLEVWIGGPDAASGGVKHGSAALPVTGSWGEQNTVTIDLDQKITGNGKDIYLVMRGTAENAAGGGKSCVANFFTFQFTQSGENPGETEKETLKAGLKATWYQDKENPGAFEGIAEIIGEGSGGNNEPVDVKHFDASYDKLFTEGFLKEVGTCILPTFEIQGAGHTTGYNIREEAAKLPGVVTKENGDVDGLIIKYQGFITADASGTYKLSSKFIDNGCVVFVNNIKVFEFWAANTWLDKADGEYVAEGIEFALEANQTLPLTVYYYEDKGGEVLQMNVSKDGAEAKALSQAGLFLSQNDGKGTITPPDGKDPAPITGDKGMSVALVALISMAVVGTVLLRKRKAHQ